MKKKINIIVFSDGSISFNQNYLYNASKSKKKIAKKDLLQDLRIKKLTSKQTRGSYTSYTQKYV